MFDELFGPFFSGKNANKIGLSALIIASLFVVWIFISSIITWHSDLQLVAAKSNVTEKKSVLADKAVTDLASLHIFGASSDVLPITSLQLHLTGIMQDPQSHSSKVIISEAGQSGKIFAIGDMLTPGIKIYDITRDGVVLAHAGRLEKLPLTRNQLVFANTPASIWKNNDEESL
jgi:type II secretory pathway component PulC